MPLVPQHIRNLKPYKPGRPIEEVRRELGLEHIIKLASNENPHGPSPKALEAVQSTLADNFRYPDASAYLLREKLAECFNIKINNVVVGAGSEGVMSTIMRTFLRQGDEIIAADNSFIGFRVLANASGVHTNWVPLKNYHHDLPEMAKQINDYTKIIYLANPDNPTGTYFPKSEFDAFMSLVPERVLVLLDEAYFEYACHLADYPDSMHYRYDNVITLRTFSKAHGLAGFRVGYGFAHEDLIQNLNKVKLPFEPAWPAQIAAQAALDDTEYIKHTISHCHKGMKILEQAFYDNGIKTIPSTANFITLIFSSDKEAQTFNEKMLHNGIILRHLPGWGLPNCVRVTVGTEEENNILMDNVNI
ncbi:MAG: histidinol-phosphate transaminase [Candidatus Marinimicrobia bacterium]|nr:histidinol-phosphate transaminase [Candidatus Neomarinimicrobiota bacterium]